MSGPRYQFAPGEIRSTEDPLEGEPRWDAIKRRLGFYNFERGVIEWFRIPGEGENENYVPQHGWDGSSLRFKNPDGSWGEYVNIGLIGVELSNASGTTKMIFKTAAGTFEAPVEVKLLDDDPNNPLNQSLMALYFQLDKLVELHDNLPKLDTVISNAENIYDVANKIAEVNRVAMSIDAIDSIASSLLQLVDVANSKEEIFLAATNAGISAQEAHDSAEITSQDRVSVAGLKSDVEVLRNTLLDSITAVANTVAYTEPASASYNGTTKRLTINIPQAHVAEFSYNDLDDKPNIPQGIVQKVTVPVGMKSAYVDPDIGEAVLSFDTGYNLITQAQTDKLAAIAEQATKNQTDSFLISRSNHTGTQDVSTITGLQVLLDDIDARAAQIADKGVPNGFAALDENGFVPLSQINEALIGGLNYQGSWDASTNTPPIPTASSANKGWYYVVEVAGTTNIDGNNEWAIGDWIVSNGTKWDKIDSSDQVTSVNGRRGAVVLGAISELNKINNSHWEAAGAALALANGGTGAKTQADAQTNLGVYSKTDTDTKLGLKFDKTGGIIDGGITVKGDITAYRTSAPSTGVIFLNNAGNRYLYYDGTRYVMPGAPLQIDGSFTTGGTVQLRSIVGVRPSADNSENAHLWFYDLDGSNRAIIYAGTDGRISFQNAKPGGTTITFHSDGNIISQRFAEWGSAYMFDAISARIEARALAWANDRVSNLQYRMVSQGTITLYASSSNGSSFVPSGAAVTGSNKANEELPKLYYRYLQVYDPVRGWVGFVNA